MLDELHTRSVRFGQVKSAAVKYYAKVDKSQHRRSLCLTISADIYLFVNLILACCLYLTECKVTINQNVVPGMSEIEVYFYIVL